MSPPTSHHYTTRLEWSGAAAGPARDYKTYSRAFTATIDGKPALQGSSDPAFLGDPRALNPEDLLLVSLASCHLLSYLALCANSGVVVVAYLDQAEGTLSQQADRGFQMSEVILHPQVVIAAGSDPARATRLHERAHEVCFIARSVNFPVRVLPTVSLVST